MRRDWVDSLANKERKYQQQWRSRETTRRGCLTEIEILTKQETFLLSKKMQISEESDPGDSFPFVVSSVCFKHANDTPRIQYLSTIGVSCGCHSFSVELQCPELAEIYEPDTRPKSPIGLDVNFGPLVLSV